MLGDQIETVCRSRRPIGIHLLSDDNLTVAEAGLDDAENLVDAFLDCVHHLALRRRGSVGQLEQSDFGFVLEERRRCRAQAVVGANLAVPDQLEKPILLVARAS